MRKCAFGGKLGLLSAVFVAGFVPMQAFAQEVVNIEEIIVYSDVGYGGRSEDSTNQTLTYDLQYFQRFEPISAGDALKRAPGVSFPSDVLESDELQLRGLPAGYAQVQINGNKVEGSGENRAFFVDRIPAELIEGVEIIRSPSADMSADQLAGAVNVKLKRAGDFTGGWVRGSIFGVEDDELRGAGSVGYGNIVGDTSFLLSFDVQQRRNPKKKTTSVFDSDGNLDEFETEDDTRDGTDYSFNGEIATKVGDGELKVFGYYVHTDRDEEEFAQKFESDKVTRTELATQNEGIEQDSYSIVSEYVQPTKSGEVLAKIGYASFDEKLDTKEKETEFEDDGSVKEFKDLIEKQDTEDEDVFGTLAYTHKSGLLNIKFGVDGRIKTRDFALSVLESEDGADFEDVTEDEGAGEFTAREERIDPYIKLNWMLSDALKLETGVRYENTYRKLDGDTFEDGAERVTIHELNPSMHAVYAVTDKLTLRGSIARTVRRPSFEELNPFGTEDNPTEDATLFGNPNLQQETSWGVDVGFDYRLEHGGVFGFNFFNRDIANKIEVSDIPGATDEYRYENFDDARAYGIELDLSTSLTAVGLENTSVFANYTWIKTELNDQFLGIKRRFNEQPEWVYNVGVSQNFPSVDMTVGVAYNKRGSFLVYAEDELEKESIDGNLEAFVEKRFGDDFVVRLSASNLLDAEKVEKVKKFDGGDVDEIEVQREESGRLFMLTGRKAF